MKIRTRLQRGLNKVLVIALFWMLFGCFSFILEFFFLYDLIRMHKVTGSYPFWPDLIGNGILWGISGLVVGYLLVFRLGSMYRNRSFAFGIVNSGLLFLLFYILLAVVLFFSMAFFYNLFQADFATAWERGWHNLVINIYTPSFFVAMIGWGLLVSVTQFMLQVNDKFGPGVLWKFTTGRYHHPREEERIFMFLDLKSSTAIAEEIGSKRFFEFLKEIFYDITEPVIESLGEIHQYVGDEVVITWTVENGLRENNCLLCFYRIEAAIEKRRAHYTKKYGHVPSFKAGIHLGEATVGEIGVIKKDIVFSGDVMNTASRIQGECNTHNVKILLSSDVLGRMPINGEYKKIRVGEILLRGKTESIELNTIQVV